MDMSKLEAGRLVGKFRPVQLGRMTADIAALFRSLAEKKGIAYEVEIETSEDEPAIYVDIGKAIIQFALWPAFQSVPRFVGKDCLQFVRFQALLV